MTPQALAQDAGVLFSLPDAAIRVNELIQSPDHTAGEVAEVVELDAALTARVLRLANSALFGHAGRIDKVSLAIVMIGEKALRDLVMATSVTHVFKGIPEEFVDMSTFWDNSATCGVVARLLAARCGIRDGERLFVAGLLHGFAIEEAFTCKDALAQVFTKDFDLVLLDMKMSDGNGLDVLQKIKAKRPNLHVVIVTGYASVDTAVEAIQKGASDYMPKPFTPDELYNMTNRVLGTVAA